MKYTILTVVIIAIMTAPLQAQTDIGKVHWMDNYRDLILFEGSLHSTGWTVTNGGLLVSGGTTTVNLASGDKIRLIPSASGGRDSYTIDDIIGPTSFTIYPVADCGGHCGGTAGADLYKINLGTGDTTPRNVIDGAGNLLFQHRDNPIQLVIVEDELTATTRSLLELDNYGGVRFDLVDSFNSITWVIQNQVGKLELTKAGTGKTELEIDGSGNITPNGDLSVLRMNGGGGTINYYSEVLGSPVLSLNHSIYNDGSSNFLCLSTSSGSSCNGYHRAGAYGISGNALITAPSSSTIAVRNAADTVYGTWDGDILKARTSITNIALRSNPGAGALVTKSSVAGSTCEDIFFDYADLAVAATTKDFVLTTLDANTILHWSTLLVNTPATHADTYTLSFGSSGTYDQIIVDSDAKAIAGTEYGLLDAERGGDLPDADAWGAKKYSRTATQALTIHADGGAVNLDQASAGAWTVTICFTVP